MEVSCPKTHKHGLEEAGISCIALLYRRRAFAEPEEQEQKIYNLSSTVSTVCPQTPAEGASISVYAAAASEMEGVGACYLYNGEKTKSSDSSYNAELQAEMWKKSCKLVGI